MVDQCDNPNCSCNDFGNWRDCAFDVPINVNDDSEYHKASQQTQQPPIDKKQYELDVAKYTEELKRQQQIEVFNKYNPQLTSAELDVHFITKDSGQRSSSDIKDKTEKPIIQIVSGTTVDVKRQNFSKFTELIGNQFNYGGDKYKLDGFEDREATDIISSVFGGSTQFDWILGTMMKYLFRFKNFQREKDLLKIATYCYILWLKQGNHLKTTQDEDICNK